MKSRKNMSLKSLQPRIVAFASFLSAWIVLLLFHCAAAATGSSFAVSANPELNAYWGKIIFSALFFFSVLAALTCTVMDRNVRVGMKVAFCLCLILQHLGCTSFMLGGEVALVPFISLSMFFLGGLVAFILGWCMLYEK